jgi:hypothetical protein
MGFARKAVVVATAAFTAVCIAFTGSASAVLGNHDRAVKATGFIAAEQKSNGSIPAFSPIGSTADAVVSLVAAGRGPTQIRKGLNYLSRQTAQGKVTEVGVEAKVVMAAVAGGRNPRSFGGVNLVQAIANTEQPDGQYFDAASFSAVFDDALAMLALEAAGETPSTDAQQWLLAAQCGDGGWQYDAPPAIGEDEHCFTGDAGSDFSESDTNTTSYAVQALESAGSPSFTHDPFAFFDAIRDTGFDGWGYTWGFQTTDTNSTALVLQAYASAGEAMPTGGMTALRALQDLHCGAFSYSWTDDGHGGFMRTAPDVGATIGGVMGLLQEPLPVAGAPVTKNTPTTPACGP